jgi:3-dehydroquinate dehydratase/shikimate dehydrogenase
MQCRAAAAPAPPAQEQADAAPRSLICTSVTATTVEAFLAEIQEAVASGVDVVELRLDFLTDFDAEQHLEQLMSACPLPYIVTYRPVWEG